MKQTEIDYLDGEFQVNEEEPSTIQECIDLIGETAVVDETTSNLRYRNKYPRVYKAVSAALSAEPHSFNKPVKEEKTLKDGTLKKIHVSDMDHIRLALKGQEASEDGSKPAVTALPDGAKIIGELFGTIAPAAPLFLKGDRTGGGGKISQAALDSANGFFAQGEDTVNEKVAIIESMVPGYKIGRDADGEVTPESFARGIQALERHLQKAAKAQALGVLGTPAAA